MSEGQQKMATSDGKRRKLYVMEVDKGRGWEPSLPGFHGKRECDAETKFWRSTKGRPMKFKTTQYKAVRDD